MRTTKSAGFFITVLLWAVLTDDVSAEPISYSDFVGDVAVVIGTTTYSCTSLSDPTCAFVSITATADTSSVQPFSATGASGSASGLWNKSLRTATIDIAFNGGQTPFSADLVASQLFVSVDQTHLGAGFGSAYDPTYPLATYGSASFKTYDLASDFTATGFAPFCLDVQLCQTGAPLYTTAGTPIIITFPFGPTFSSFFSALGAAGVPEPATGLLLSLGIGALGIARGRAVVGRTTRCALRLPMSRNPGVARV
jgi:hypothetical protein